MKRKHLSWGLGLLLAALGVWLVVKAVQPRPRFVYGLQPISADEAVLLTRANAKDATYFWAQLVRIDGTVVWNQELSPAEVHEALGYSGIAASEDRVVLLAERDTKTVVLGLDRATGAQLWEKTLEGEGGPEHIGPKLIVDGPRVYVVHGQVQQQKLTALALADGVVLWTLAPEGGRVAQLTLLSPGVLVLTAFGTPGQEIEGATGQVRRTLPLHWQLCAIQSGIIGYEQGELALLRPAVNGGQIQRFALASQLMPQGPCGDRAGDVIVGTSMKAGVDVQITRLDPSSGAVRWQLSLGDWILSDRNERADGRLPRFLPVVLFNAEEGGPIQYELVIVDLDTGKVVERRSTRTHMTPFVTAERAYVMAGQTLYALDPATGALASATRFGPVQASSLRAEDFRFGPLWLAGLDFGGPKDLPWVAFDLSLAKPIRLNGEASVMDVTAEGWPAPR